MSVAMKEGDRHPDEARVERRRMDRHPVVLQKRVQPLPSGSAVVRNGERVLVHHHQNRKNISTTEMVATT